jgi:hypothetical protein
VSRSKISGALPPFLFMPLECGNGQLFFITFRVINSEKLCDRVQKGKVAGFEK